MGPLLPLRLLSVPLELNGLIHDVIMGHFLHMKLLNLFLWVKLAYLDSCWQSKWAEFVLLCWFIVNCKLAWYSVSGEMSVLSVRGNTLLNAFLFITTIRLYNVWITNFLLQLIKWASWTTGWANEIFTVIQKSSRVTRFTQGNTLKNVNMFQF